MQPLILLLLNDRLVRLNVKKELEDKAQVYAAVTLDEVIAEIKWTEIGAILLDMTDEEMDAYAMLNVINSTYPSVPLLLLVNRETGEASLEQFRRNPQNNLFDREPNAAELARELLRLAEGKTRKAPPEEGDHLFLNLANQQTRLRNNVRRIEDFAFGEVETALKENRINWNTIDFLETVNVGLEGFLQIQIEGNSDWASAAAGGAAGEKE